MAEPTDPLSSYLMAQRGSLPSSYLSIASAPELHKPGLCVLLGKGMCPRKPEVRNFHQANTEAVWT
jgi:hypothetical protein